MIELEDENKGSSFNSRKIKKIEFSDESISKHKRQKDKAQKKNKEVGDEDDKEFTYSTLERLIFEDEKNPDNNSMAFSRR